MREILEERTLGGLHQALEAEVEGLPRSTAALDIGCGSGAWLARLKRLGFVDLWGIDAGERPALDGVSFVRANLDFDHPGIEKKFGLITVIEVIEHLANPGAVIALVARLLAPDGIAVLTSPNIHSLHCRLRFMLTGKLASFDEKGDPTHTTPLLLPGFCKTAARLGLDLERGWTYPQRQSLAFGAPIRIAASILRCVVPDPYPGDTLCLRLKLNCAAGLQAAE